MNWMMLPQWQTELGWSSRESNQSQKMISAEYTMHNMSKMVPSNSRTQRRRELSGIMLIIVDQGKVLSSQVILCGQISGSTLRGDSNVSNVILAPCTYRDFFNRLH